MQITVRRAEIKDAERIARVHVASWRAAYRGHFPDEYLDGLSWQERAEQWRADLDEGTKLILVAHDGNELLGFATAGPSRDDDLTSDVLELYALYLDPERWARGAGTALLNAVLDTTDQQVVLWVLEGNRRAIRFYEARGFQADGAVKTIERGGHPGRQLRYRTRLRPIK
jgi:GNAT superfamily N-acetyltransferase